MDPQAIKTLITCPLTKQIYHTPVIAYDQEIYEEDALHLWMGQRDNKSPKTMKRMKWGWYKVTFLEPIIQDYLKNHPEARRYDPENPEAGQPQVEPHILATWIRKRKLDKLAKYLELGDPNVTVIDQGKPMTLLNLALKLGYVEGVTALLESSRLKYNPYFFTKVTDPTDEDIWRSWLSPEYQGTLDERVALLKLLKKRKILTPSFHGFFTILQFIELEFVSTFLKHTKTIWKGHKNQQNKAFESLKKHPQSKELIKLLIPAGVLEFWGFVYYYGDDTEIIQVLLQQPLTEDQLAQGFKHLLHYPDSLELLLQTGADINHYTDDNTPFMDACECSSSAVEKMIYYHPDVNKRSKLGQDTVLHMACCPWGKKDILPLVQLLLDHGADPDATNEYGETPEQYLNESEPDYEQIVQLLRSKRSDSIKIIDP